MSFRIISKPNPTALEDLDPFQLIYLDLPEDLNLQNRERDSLIQALREKYGDNAVRTDEIISFGKGTDALKPTLQVKIRWQSSLDQFLRELYPP